MFRVCCSSAPAYGVLCCAIHAHYVSRIESRRATRAFLTGFHLRGLSCRDHNPFHRVRADGTVNKCLGLVLRHRVLRLRASLNVHASSFLTAYDASEWPKDRKNCLEGAG